MNECFVTLLFILTVGVRVDVLADVVSLATAAEPPVICPLVKTDDSSVVVSVAEPCVSYSCFIYSLRLASGVSTLEQLVFAEMGNIDRLIYDNLYVM